MNGNQEQILTRILISDNGDLVITDLWEEVQTVFTEMEGEELVLQDQNL